MIRRGPLPAAEARAHGASAPEPSAPWTGGSDPPAIADVVAPAFDQATAFSHHPELLGYFEELQQAHLQARLRSSAGGPAVDHVFGPAFDRGLAVAHFPELTSYLDELELAYRQNREPILVAQPFLDDIVRGLNAADPTLKLQRLEFSPKWSDDNIAQSPLALSLQQHLGSAQAFRVLLDGEGHRAALSVYCSGSSNDVSMLLVDSFELHRVQQEAAVWDKALNTIASLSQARLGAAAPPVRLHLALMGAATQKTLAGCGFFALSTLKKMTSESYVADLHEKNLRDLAGARTDPGVHVLPATDLPPAFFKHATSKTVVKDYLKAKAREREEWLQAGSPGRQQALVDPDAPVNKKGGAGETLLERYDRHVIARGNFKYSNSYEAKGIELVRTALLHLTRGKSPGDVPFQ